MKNVLIVVVISLLIPFLVKGQESVISEINYTQLEKFISLAKSNYPRQKIFRANEEKAKSGVPLAKAGYLDMLSASYIYRPDQKASINFENPYQINGFQFGVNLNLGSFFQKPFQVKQAKADYEVAQLEAAEYDKVLANEVKSRYYAYLQYKNDLSFKTQAVQDNRVVMDDWKKKFEQAAAELADYNEAKSNYTSSVSDQLEAEVNYLKAKDALEEIIGVSLDAVN